LSESAAQDQVEDHRQPADQRGRQADAEALSEPPPPLLVAEPAPLSPACAPAARRFFVVRLPGRRERGARRHGTARCNRRLHPIAPADIHDAQENSSIPADTPVAFRRAVLRRGTAGLDASGADGSAVGAHRGRSGTLRGFLASDASGADGSAVGAHRGRWLAVLGAGESDAANEQPGCEERDREQQGGEHGSRQHGRSIAGSGAGLEREARFLSERLDRVGRAEHHRASLFPAPVAQLDRASAFEAEG
jgi:hypothetical protein